MDMILGLSVNVNIVSLFSVTYVVCTHWDCLFELPQRGNSDVYLQRIFSNN